MLKKRFKNILTDRGFILTVILAMGCMVFFFGKLLKQPNQVYFGPGGDGLQAYYGAMYHVKHDTRYWHLDGMNYPFGDQVFFTGCQPFISNPIKLISSIIDISDYTVGILNTIMLFSVFFCALCLYLIFKHLRLPYIYSALAAIAITFLSPQIYRLTAHYSLTYQFAIPLFLLLLMKFHQLPSIKKSFLISSVVFFMAGTHFYFFGFFALISVFYWGVLFFQKISWNNLKFIATHLFIQIILPFLIFQFILFLIDNVHDRTNNPWGYLTYTSNLAGVFFPSGGKPYQAFLSNLIKPEYPLNIEGYAYIGLVSTIFTGFLILIFLKRIALFEFKKLVWITDVKILNIFFWTSLFALILSFGYPFKIRGYEYLFQYAGLLKQMRGISRFSWAFYYIINIIAFYRIWHWVSDKRPITKHTLVTIALLIIGCDAYYMTQPMGQALNNPIKRLEDKTNSLPENKWLNEINTNKYQAIITLPYVHVGSENIWRYEETFDILGEVYIASFKTGLPTTSSMMSRTSLSQTYKNIQIVLEPYRKLEILSDFKNKKPLLVMVIEKQLNNDEKLWLTMCKKIKETPNYNLYELPFEALEHRADSLYLNTLAAMKRDTTYTIDSFQYTSPVKTFVYNKFDSRTNLNTSTNDYYIGKIGPYNLLFFDTMPNFNKEQEYSVSFWMDNFTEDLYPRTLCTIECVDSLGVSYNRQEFGVGQQPRLRIIDGSRALVETRISIKKPNDHLAIAVSHIDIYDEKKMFKATQLFIQPVNHTIYKLNGQDSIMCNNRIYLNN